MRRLNIERLVVLGHSWGTLVASWMAHEQPESLRALVLVSGYYTPSLRLDLPFMSAPAIPLLGTLMRNTISPVLGRLLWPLMTRRLFAPADVTEAFKKDYPVWLSLRPGQATAQVGAAIDAAFDMSPVHAGKARPPDGEPVNASAVTV